MVKSRTVADKSDTFEEVDAWCIIGEDGSIKAAQSDAFRIIYQQPQRAFCKAFTTII